MNNSPEASFKLDLWNIITETYEHTQFYFGGEMN